MLPSGAYVENTDDVISNFLNEEVKENTQTFGLNLTRNIIGGKIDGLAALEQRIYLKLTTEADQYIIYPWTYGITTIDLIGKPVHYVAAVIPDRIKEALSSDDEITDISDFEFETSGKKLHVTFTVHSIYGNFTKGTVIEL